MDGQQSSQLGWGDSEWNKVYQIVTDEANKVNVAGSFLPCYGPLAASAEVVRKEYLGSARGDMLWVDDSETVKLCTLTVLVQLKQAQVSDTSLSAALLAFRRAANLIARAEDALVFNGMTRAESTGHPEGLHLPPLVRISCDESMRGLVREGRENGGGKHITFAPGYGGQDLVTAVAMAISHLEGQGHLGPFACILGAETFIVAHTPDAHSLVLPRDRIVPLLEGPLLRSGTLEASEVVIVSLAGDPVDLVVATAPTVQFLNVNDEAAYTFRVYERFTLRIKESRAVFSFTLSPKVV